MKINKNTFFYLISIGLFVLLKWIYRYAENDDLLFLLKPIDFLIGFFSGSDSYYFSNHGFFHEDLKIYIDKSCSGFNFWVLSFVLISYLFIKHSDKTLNKFISIPIALLCAYLFTILVNTSRIITSIIVQKQTKNMLLEYQPVIHEAIGIITNLTFLILAYLLIEKFLQKIRDHEKFA